MTIQIVIKILSFNRISSHLILQNQIILLNLLNDWDNCA